ncbi:MAG TPA: hypothetical protein VGD40_25440 [Chryseosolibacter sp.]
MSAAILSRVEEHLKQYSKDHAGQKPLYILVSPHEADELLAAVKSRQGFKQDVLVTDYKGSKIVQYDALKQGDMRLTNDLPGD